MVIEAIERATPTQRLLAARYAEIHRKFFPRPPAFPTLTEAAIVEPPQVEPAPPPAPEPPPMPRRALRLIRLEETRLRMKIIRRAVCQSFEISKEELLSSRRTKEIVLPRHVYSYLVTQLTKASLPMIARSLDQDHTTILHAIRRIALRISSNREFGERLRLLQAAIRAELGEEQKPHGCIGRYVEHRRVYDYLLLGWMWPANLNAHTALLIWPCDCRFVEPKQ